MENRIKILIVDDHQLILEGIYNALKEYPNYIVSHFNTCDEAYDAIKEAEETDDPFQLLFTDLSFDNQTEETVLDGGEMLISKVREDDIAIKAAVLSGHSETNRVFNVITNIKPDAYILKSHCSGEELNFAIQQIMKGKRFYTHEIHEKILKRNIIQIQMDEIAIRILKELPKQSKISNLDGVIPKGDGSFLKIRSIENKLANLRIDLGANNNTDLVIKAKELGIID